MKRWPKAEFKLHGKRYGEVITDITGSFVATTMQLEQGKTEAELRAYLVAGEYANGDIKLRKHPIIKGRPAR